MIDPQGAIIGCLLLGKNEGEIIGQVNPEVFTMQDYADIYDLLLSVYSNKGKIDPMCVAVFPPNLKQLATECAATVPAISQWEYFIELSNDLLAKSRAESIAWQIGTGKLEINEIRELSQQLIQVTNDTQNHTDSMSLQDGLADFIKRKQYKPKYIKTGFSKLDKYAQISPGDVVVLGAKPSAGKTAFALQLGVNMARQALNVVFFSLETSIPKVYDRIITSAANLDFWKVKHHDMETEWENLQGLSDEFADLNLTVINASGKTIKWMQAESVRLKADVAFIDYLQIVYCQGYGSRYEKVTQLSADAHIWAQSTGTCVVELSQLKRDGEHKKPSMDDLRESGQIEQDADLILLLENNKDKDEYFVHIAKNKDGMTGQIEMKFDGLHQRHYEVDNAR